MLAHAQAKAHSTLQEALEVADKMGAYRWVQDGGGGVKVAGRCLLKLLMQPCFMQPRAGGCIAGAVLLPDPWRGVGGLVERRVQGLLGDGYRWVQQGQVCFSTLVA
jgi:hypothetical protein